MNHNGIIQFIIHFSASNKNSFEDQQFQMFYWKHMAQRVYVYKFIAFNISDTCIAYQREIEKTSPFKDQSNFKAQLHRLKIIYVLEFLFLKINLIFQIRLNKKEIVETWQMLNHKKLASVRIRKYILDVWNEFDLKMSYSDELQKL